MGNSAISLTGRGVEMKVDTPFHVQTDVCMACGACASVCPTGHITLEKSTPMITKKQTSPSPVEYDMGLKGRKPVYVPYAQAVPNTPAIDRDVCVHFKTGGCRCARSSAGWTPSTTPWKTRSSNSKWAPSFWRPGSNPSIRPSSTATTTPTIPT
jgi:heterodisulfide reductase subunit A